MTPTSSESLPIEFEVRCAVSGPSLRIVRRFVEAVALEMGFDKQGVAQIEMAVDEACANVLLHAYPPRETNAREAGEEAKWEGEETGILVVQIRLDARAFCISVIDKGVGDQGGPHQGIRSVREYCSREDGFHGLGTYIMHSFMDEVEFDYPKPKGTVVRMTKYLDVGRINS